MIEAPDRTISDELSDLAVNGLNHLDKCLESAYKWLERMKDACDEQLEPKTLSLSKMSYDGIVSYGDITEEKNEIKIEQLDRLTYGNSYSLRVEYPDEYSGNSIEYWFNAYRSDEPQVREIKLYKNTAERPYYRRDSIYTDLAFYDAVSNRYISGVKAKIVLRDITIPEPSLDSGEWLIAEWETGNPDPETGDPDFFMELEGLAESQGKPLRYFLSAEVPEGYEPMLHILQQTA